MALDNVCKVALDIDPARLAGEEGECGPFGRAFEAVARASIRRFAQPSFVWRLCRLLRVGPEKELRKELAVLNGFAMKVVRERKARREEEITSQRDLLSRLVALDGDCTDEFLRDMIVSFVLAGRDTSTGLAWFFWALSAEPGVQRRILDEIGAVRAKHGRSDEVLSMDELRDMDYLHAAVSESLRLYPPVALSTRVSVADDTLPDGSAVKTGRQVMYCMHAMGRLEVIWGPDWREFRPERWLEKGMFKARSSYEFPVFNAGPRLCLGREMAYTQMKAVAAAVVERFDLVLAEEGRRETEQITAHRMKYGLPVRVRVRKGAAQLVGA